MPNSIAFAQNYTGILDEVYQRASVSGCLNSGRRLIRASQNAREIKIPVISVTGLGDYTRNVGYRDGSITMAYETKSPNYDRLHLLADVMDVEEGEILDAFVAAGAELQRTQVAPEADAFTFSQIAGFTGVTTTSEDLSSADAEDILASLRAVTNEMDEKQVLTGSRYLFITPTLNGVLADFSAANPNRSNRVLERFARIVEVPQVRFYTAIDLLSGGDDGFGYRKREAVYELTEEERGKVREALSDPASPLGQRDRAMGCMLFYTGMRACDIAALRLDAIDWENDSISTVQQKTGAPLALPLVAQVGNALFDYVTGARGPSADPHVFLSLSWPYGGIKPKTVCRVAGKVLDAAGVHRSEGDERGSHLFRRTLATSMMGAGADRSVIMATLGHSSPAMAERYMVADVEGLRRCSLDVSAFPLAKGVL